MWIAPRFDATLSENGVAFPPRRGSREFSHSLESGNPGFKCLARLARDLKSYLWVADPRQVTFLCLSVHMSKEKLPKEKTPRSARLLPSCPGCAESRRTRSAAWESTGLPPKPRPTPPPPG